MPVTHLLVDDLHSLEAANVPGATVWSCSTGLPYLAGAGEVRAPDALIDQAAFDAFNRRLLSAREAIARAFVRQESRAPGFAHLRASQAAQAYFALVAFANKGLILARWCEAVGGDHAVAGCPELSPPRGLGFAVGFHDHVFAAIAAEVDRGWAQAPALIPTPAIDPRLHAETFHRVPAFDKAFNVVNRTAGALGYRIWRKLKIEARPWRRRGTLLLLSDNEGIEESFPALLRRGWRIVPVALPAAPTVAGEAPDLAGLAEDLRRAWAEAVGEALPAPVADACWRLFWKRAATAMAAHPAHLEHCRRTVALWREAFGRGSEPLLALGSGLYLPHLRLLDACLREAGIPVVCTDHGAGMALMERHRHTAAELISFSDFYGAYGAEARRAYESHRRDREQRIHVIGTPAVLSRCRARGLQRALARRRLGVGRGTPLLIYVTCLAANNVQLGYGTGTDFAYATFQRRLVPLLGRFPGRVVVKPYPAHRFADPEQIWVMPLPENAVRAPFGEFRHIRWAADVLLLDLTSSTIGWALGPDIPLVYVDNHQSATTARARAALSRAVFYADAREPGWEHTVADVLTLPPAEIRRRWQAMAANRRRFVEDFVLGPRGGFAEGLAAMLEAAAEARAAEPTARAAAVGA